MSARSIPVSSFSVSLRGLLRTLVCTGMLMLSLPLMAANDNLQSLFNFQTKMAAAGNSEAMIKLGEMYEEGLGTERSEEHAREWYQKALDKGNPEAQGHLDRLQKKGARPQRGAGQ
ncbi:MAG TPA: hypothetical protein VGE50_08900 [Gammaproteobacteria bacterium]